MTSMKTAMAESEATIRPVALERVVMPLAATIAPEWLLRETFAVQYSPNCPKRFLVRLCGKNAGGLDMKWYDETRDAYGFGDTIAEAANEAKARREDHVPVSEWARTQDRVAGRVVREMQGQRAAEAAAKEGA